MEVEHYPIPNRLKMHRRMQGLQQHHVAKLLGFQTTTQLSQWENGRSMPDGIQLLKLGIIYCTLPNELYFELFQALKDELTAHPVATN